jgi:hypothetical protein
MLLAVKSESDRVFGDSSICLSRRIKHAAHNPACAAEPSGGELGSSPTQSALVLQTWLTSFRQSFGFFGGT